ncbi:MAG: histidinol-phosphate transaminase [Porticoccus sp.]|nr:histidinol-phosphate transaminase [Porticoccus sp.]
MTVDLKSLALPGVQHLKPYQGGKPIEEVERELGISGVIKLASNENPLGLSSIARAAIEAALVDGARYPDGNGYYLKCKLAKKLSVNPDQLTLGNGSNDVLDLVARGFLGAVHNAIFSQHAFVIYQLAVTAQSARSVVVPARNWGHDLQAMADAVDDSTRLIFVANPNNPTGTWVGLDEIKVLMARVPSQVLVVIDEAYFEYADLPEYGSALKLLDLYPNLIITRTFSKAYGLASLRVGYAISHPDVADILNRIRQPFNINSLALAAAVAVLDDQDYLDRSIEINRRGYEQLTNRLSQMGLNFIPSAGNFVAVEIPGDVQGVYQHLLERGVIVRPVGLYEMPDHLRVSIGLPEENQRFLDELDTLLSAGENRR